MDTKPDSNAQDGCIQAVTSLFPDICLEYLDTLAVPLLYNSEAVINQIIDLVEAGTSYTRRPQVKILKRKRDDDDDDDDDDEDEVSDAKRKYASPSRAETSLTNRQMMAVRKLITGDFPLVSKDVQKLLTEHGMNLMPTYLALHEIVSSEDQAARSLTLKKRPSIQEAPYRPENIDGTINKSKNEAEKDMLKELRAARLIRASLLGKKQKEAKAKEAERKDHEQAKARGLLMECECCFTEFTMSRLVHCDGEISHWFCNDCARRNAETLIGLSKYEMSCMSMDGCEGGFSRTQRTKFLDKKLIKALDQIEQEAVLRMAGIENLASCPFCPFAAEYPPVEENREFRCENPTCQIVSCRLCNAHTHIPKTCAEAALENGIPARRGIEEAMTAALIRKCNKCSTPFIKESGCNKMRCTRRGCKNIQCYVCSKSCDYSHFNDPGRGGKAGNCPLFDVTENRHEEEIRAAQEEAKKLAAEQNPGVNPELLDIKMSDRVTEDDERRRRRDPYVNQRELYLDEAHNLGAEAEAAFAGVGVGAVGAVGAVGVGARAVAGAIAGIVPAFRPEVEFRQLQFNLQEQDFQDPDAAALPALGEGFQMEAAQIQAEAQRAALIREARAQVAQGVQIQQAEAAEIQAARAHAARVRAAQAQARAQVQVELAQLPDNFGQMMQRAAHNREQHIRRQQDVRQPQDPVQQLHNELQQLENLEPHIPQGLVMERPKKHREQRHHRIQRQQQQQQEQRRQQFPRVLPQVLPPQPVQPELPQQRQMPCRQPRAPAQEPVQHQQNQQHQQHQPQIFNVYHQPQQVDVANPNGNNKDAMPAAGQNAAHDLLPQASNRVQGWLNRLQGFDLGFGPLQRLDFGRAFPSHGRAQIQGVQPELLNPWIDDPRELHVRWADRAVPFGARYGALGQAPEQQP